MAVADVYDALSSKRVYKSAFPHEVAKDILLKESGKHFDPNIIAAFQAAEEQFLAVRTRYRDPIPEPPTET